MPKQQRMDKAPHWYALYVRPRTEKKVAERLSQRGLQPYCPVQTVLRQWSDRKKKVSEPLFKSYVFVRCDAHTRLEVLQTPGVMAFVHWLGRPAVIRDEEIEAIKVFLEEYEAISLVAHASYRAGQEVEVKYGPMMGNHGKVIRQTRHKVALRIEQLGLDLIAEVPKSHLEPVR